MTMIENLLELLKERVQPPESPHFAGTENEWSTFQTREAIELPLDYRLLLSVYGVGEFFNFFFLTSPFSPGAGFAAQSTALLSQYCYIRRVGKGSSPFPVFPESDGLLAFGGDTNGGVLAWLTEGKSCDWKTVHLSDNAAEFEVFDYGALALLTKVAARELIPQFMEGIEFIDWDKLRFRQFTDRCTSPAPFGVSVCPPNAGGHSRR